MIKNSLALLMTFGFGAFYSTSFAAVKVESELVNNLGECDGARRIVVYDQEAIFVPGEHGAYRCYELQDRIETLNREFSKKRTELQERSRQLKMMSQDPEANNDPYQVAIMMKEQSALDIDAKAASQAFQTELNRVQGEFMREVHTIIDELAQEFEWDLVLPIDRKVSFVSAKIDMTEKITTRLNEKYRAKERAKKFADSAAKKNTAASAKK